MKSSPIGLIGVGGSMVQVDDPIGEIPIKANTVEGRAFSVSQSVV